MTDFAAQAEEWLTNEDRVTHEDRLSRMQWLASQTPNANYLRFDGWLTKSLYEEARYSFVYAQFLGSAILVRLCLKRAAKISDYPVYCRFALAH